MKIIITAGGTGGHIYPAISLAEELKIRKHDITFIGSKDRMEKDIVPQKGFNYIGLDIYSTRGGIVQKIKSIFSIFNAYKKCLSIIEGYDVAIGFGNYISIPVIMAAHKLKLKTIIHEQNSFVGRANKFLDKKVDLVIGSYEENLQQFKNANTKILGNPQSSVARNIKTNETIISDLGLNPNKKTVVIFMGSLGSSSVNKIIIDYLKLLDGSYQVIYATGKSHYNETISKVNNNDFIKIFEHIDGINVMKNSTLLISRAGATTLAEIEALGMPAILIPSPYVPNNHQYYNAKALTDKNAAIMIEEKNLTADLLYKSVSDIINNDEKLKEMSKNASELCNLDSLNSIVEEIENI